MLAAAAYPTRPVKIVVGYTPGGFTDTMTRSVSPSLYPKLPPTPR